MLRFPSVVLEKDIAEASAGASRGQWQGSIEFLKPREFPTGQMDIAWRQYSRDCTRRLIRFASCGGFAKLLG